MMSALLRSPANQLHHGNPPASSSIWDSTLCHTCCTSSTCFIIICFFPSQIRRISPLRTHSLPAATSLYLSSIHCSAGLVTLNIRQQPALAGGLVWLCNTACTGSHVLQRMNLDILKHGGMRSLCFSMQAAASSPVNSRCDCTAGDAEQHLEQRLECSEQCQSDPHLPRWIK